MSPPFESVPESAQQAQIVMVQAAHDHVEHGAAAQGEEHHELEDGEAAAFLLDRRLGIAFLVARRVGQLRRRAVHHFDRAAVELPPRSDPLVGSVGGAAQRLFQPLPGQAVARLDIGRVVRIDPPPAVQAEECLDVADHLAAGGGWVEQLPHEAFEGQAQAEDALATVGPLLGGRQERGREDLAQVVLELTQGGLAEGVGGAPAQGGQPGAEGGKERCFHIRRYIYRPIDTRAMLLFMKRDVGPLQARYTRLRARLSQVGWISHGYVQDRGPGAGGPCYQWTRKVKAKTVSVALSKEQYEALQQAIANWKELQEILRQMQALSRQVIFETLPGPTRRKRLGKQVLGLI